MVVSCDWNPPLSCENLEFFLNFCLVLKQYITFEQYSTLLLFLVLSFIYYFRKYNEKHRNCLYTGGRPLHPPGAITMVDVNLKRTFSSGEWEKGAAIKDNVIIVDNVCPSNIKLQQSRTKKKRENLYSYKLLTSLIQSNITMLFTNCTTNLIKYKCILFILSPFSGLKQFTHLLNTPMIVLDSPRSLTA